MMPRIDAIVVAALTTLAILVVSTDGANTADSAEHELEPPVNEVTKQFWSFQCVTRPDPPLVKQQEWIRNEIDAFVLAKLEAEKLRPSRPLDKVALLRRAYYDLTGLPPRPKAVEDFLADESLNAFEKVIDGLLESPHYGEKWARHWLDLVRYAETNSYERDAAKPDVWRYRDYVIRSFNDDKPYDQFMMEQLAGDELDEVTHESIIATGYYRLGIWQDEPVDRVQELYEDLDDMVRTTGELFLGLTVGCSRCHDHKLDPIPQKDYYRLLAFFHGIDRDVFSQRPIASDQEIQEQQAEITAHEAEVDEVNVKIAGIEKLVVDDFQSAEREDFKHEQHKIPLIKKRVPEVLTQEQFDEYVELKMQQKRLQDFKPKALDQALCVTEIGRKPRETFVLARGSAHTPGEMVEPGFPAVLGFPDPEISEPRPGIQSSGRRRALSEWLASRENPLTARVMVNRIWQQFFRRGIVRSPNNFGFQGVTPTHPELLEWLACEFMDGGWRLKRMHKLIMLSAAYQQSSRENEQALTKDPENNLFWRQNMRRLSAEEIRDSILAVNGSLNPKMFGPSIYPVIPDEVKQGQSQPGSGWGDSSPEERARRSIYIHIKRSLLVPMMVAFDVADTDNTCPIRFATTQPTQALGMMNSAYLNQQAKVFADSLREEAGDQSKDHVELALRRVLQRNPTFDEIARGTDLLDLLCHEYRIDANKALEYYCLVALNLNEFMYLD